MKLQGKRVVVTGATSGIGREITEELAQRGASVVAVGRDEQELADLTDLGGRVEPFRADITSRAGQTSLVEHAGRVHALVNDAGVGWVGLFADMPVDEIERIVAVNILAVMTLTRRLLPALEPGGHIVNIGSVLGVAPSPPLSVYSATKFAVHGFSESLRVELAGRAHVTEVQPGPVDSRFFERATHRPRAAEVPRFPMMDPGRVAAAAIRALEHPGRPGYRRIAVPRGFGALTRLATVPGPRLLRSGISRVAGSSLVLRPHPRKDA